MQNTTLLFLIKRKDGEINDICLAMKKRSFGAGRWNGVGGKLLDGESIEDAIKREANEEIGIIVRHENLKKVAELEFIFSNKEEWHQVVHVFLCENWEHEPGESEEMNPRWFSVGEIPFDQMWPSDTLWVPRILKGELLEGKLVLGEGDMVLEQQIKNLTSF